MISQVRWVKVSAQGMLSGGGCRALVSNRRGSLDISSPAWCGGEEQCRLGHGGAKAAGRTAAAAPLYAHCARLIEAHLALTVLHPPSEVRWQQRY